MGENEKNEEQPETLSVEVTHVVEKLLERQTSLQQRLSALDELLALQQAALRDAMATLREAVDGRTRRRPPANTRPDMVN